ncbi:DUF1376 domain-containing protein [Sphingomonas sp. OK281]|uniref:DUF1376 domain-containing protein n=1 Tax=Sphingomonas sp. OK281 TaxID=1881067 RepID=UPI0008EEACF0|nr:DUF1376 domain-containing protein [Sphingomonas sp. OK281]SFN72232.1 Protein of unknown function [Sphingomonas sp. OK281]
MPNADLPAPLTPSDCDLRDFAFMPVDTVRLLDSDLFALSSGDEFKAAMTLWCKAWQQVPAGSLPADDRVLAHLSGAGTKWKKLRTIALRGFVECSDGRLYHPVVCEKATEAWAKKLSYRERSKKGNSKRWGSQKDEQQHSQSDPSGTTFGILEPPKGQGEGQKKDSVTIVTGAVPSPIDPKKVLFDAGVALLGEAGLSAKTARSLIAKWFKNHGEEATNAALLSAAGRAEPVSWIEARLRTKVAAQDEAREASRSTAERYRRMAIPGPPADARKLEEHA